MSRIRFTFTRDILLAYISHLDMLRLFIRALRRSNLPLEYSQGYSPHPRFTLALPLPLGVTAGEEFGEVYFSETIEPGFFKEKLAFQLPKGLELTNAFLVSTEAPSIAALVRAASYRAKLKETSPDDGKINFIKESLEKLLSKEEIIMKRTNKKKKIISTNVRPFIKKAEICYKKNTGLELMLELEAGSQGGISPVFFLEQLQGEAPAEMPGLHEWQIHREKLIFTDNPLSASD